MGGVVYIHNTIYLMNLMDKIYRGDYREFCCFDLSLRYKKGVQFCFRYTKGFHCGKK